MEDDNTNFRTDLADYVPLRIARYGNVSTVITVNVEVAINAVPAKFDTFDVAGTHVRILGHCLRVIDSTRGRG